VKFSEQPPADTVHCWETLKGRRLLGNAGCFRGVVVPDELTDDCKDLEGLPFQALMFSYFNGGYSLTRTEFGKAESRPKARDIKPSEMPASRHKKEDIQREIQRRKRRGPGAQPQGSRPAKPVPHALGGP
jgi:hypothetical protein